MSDLTLRINGQAYTDWTSVQIQRSLDSLAHSFDLGISTAQTGGQDPAQDILEGDICEVIFRGETIISGYVDNADQQYSASSLNITVNGRSRAGDLVDCAAIHKPWRNTGVLQIAQDLCAPFDIQVESTLIEELPKERYFKLAASGETVFDALDRLARSHALRVLSYADGSVYFTRTGDLRYPDVLIAPGLNVISGGYTRSMEERFSNYIFRSQLATSAEINGKAAARRFELLDDGVDRYRPMVVDLESQGRNSSGQYTSEKVINDLEQAALWERNTRAGKARQLRYEVGNPNDMAGSWLNSRGEIWEPNTVVSVRDSIFGVEGEFLITEVTLTRDNRGTRTSLALTHPDAYDIKKPPAKKSKKKGYTW